MLKRERQRADEAEARLAAERKYQDEERQRRNEEHQRREEERQRRNELELEEHRRRIARSETLFAELVAELRAERQQNQAMMRAIIQLLEERQQSN